MRRSTGPLSLSSPLGWRYACHVLVGVVIAALLLQTWLVQGVIVPVTISAGSMAETHYGPHRQVQCYDCGFRFACGLDRLPRDGRARCLNCGARDNLVSNLPDQAGDRVGIDRSAFQFRAPRRWEEVVFRNPDAPQQYWIKRVVGLPGETVTIDEGDVRINGALARKTLPQTRGVAQLVHDAAFVPRQVRPDAPQWQPADTSSAWKRAGQGYACEAAGGATDWLVFQPLGGRPITDDYGYNPGASRRLNRVHDLGLRCMASLQGSGVLHLRARDGREQFDVSLDCARRVAELRHNGQVVKTAPLPSGIGRGSVELELWLVDQQVLFAVDRLPQLHDLYQREAGQEASTTPLAIGASRLSIDLQPLRVWRDVYYTAAGRQTPVQLENDLFFVLGDNSPLSLDSRHLPRAGIASKLLVGKPLPLWGR